MKFTTIFIVAVLFLVEAYALTCGDNEVEVTDCPRQSEPTCSGSSTHLRLDCISSECYCAKGYVREPLTKTCYAANDCPDFSFLYALMDYLKTGKLPEEVNLPKV